MTEMTLVQVRLPRPLVKLVDHVAIDEETSRQEMVRRLLQEALTARGET